MPEDGGACPPGGFKCDQSLLPLITRRHVQLGVSVPLLLLPYLVESIAQEGTFVRINLIVCCDSFQAAHSSDPQL